MYDEGIRSLLAAMVPARLERHHLRRSQRGQDDPAAGAHARRRARRVAGHPGVRTPELRLDELLPHLNFRAFYERIANSEGQGELDLTELSKRLKRHNPTRTIVGEVRRRGGHHHARGMSAGADGGWSTMHANSAAVFPASTPTRPAPRATGHESTSTSWLPRRSMSSCSSASCLTAAGSSRDLPRRVLRPVDEPDGHR